MGTAREVRVLLFAVVASLAAATGVDDALSQSWTYRAAPAPIIRNISPFANNPVAGTTTLIVSTLTDGMYKGTDNGTTITWQKINIGIPVVQVRSHAVISANPITDLYAATQGAGLYKSTNGGTSWTAINGSGANALACRDVRTVAVPVTTNPRTLLVSTSCLNNSGVYRSIDDGANWTRLGPAAGSPGSLPADVQASSINRNGTLYLFATSNYGIFKSTDDGATWATANALAGGGSLGNNVFNVAFSGASGTAELLAYVHGSGMYRSADTGATWTPSNGTLANVLPAGFAALGGVNRESGQTLNIGLDKQGVYRTIDGGLNWLPWGATASDGDAKYTRTVAVDVSVAGKYYLGTLNGVLKTSDNALTVVNSDMPDGGRINAITHDRDAGYVAYVALHFPLKINYIYGDYNSEALFTLLDNGVTGATSDGVVYQDRHSPATPAPLYVATNNRGIFKSTNGGTSFAAINNGLPSMIGQINRLAFDPTPSVPENSKVLYLGLSDAGGVYKSTDGGANWVTSSTGLSSPLALSVHHVAVDTNNPAIVWIGTGAGVFKSVNGGANWTLKYSAVDGAGSTLPAGIVRVRPGNSSEIYIANNHVNANGTFTASSGILKSIDGGNIWSNILPNQNGSQVRVTVSGDIYAGVSAQTGNPAVYLSTNGGTSFTPYSTNLLGSDIRAFGIAADDSAMISLSLENGFYTNDAIPIPPTVPLAQTITEAPNVFQKLVFPPQTLGTTSAPKSVTIKNLGATAAVIAGFAADNEAFVVQGHTCGTSLAAGASCTVSVVFAPNPPIAGETQGTLTVAGSGSGFSVGLWGVGASPTLPFARVSLTPGAVPAYPEWFSMGSNFRELSFGNRAIGSSRTLSYTLTNYGGGLLNINPITVDNPRFVLGGTCGATLAAGASCLVSFTYTPIAVGTDLGNVSITTDSTATVFGQLNFSLTGVGETAGATGSLLSTFGDAGRTFISTGPYGTETVLSLAHQATDGKTLALVMARKTVEDGVSVPAVVRLNTNGTLDNTFGTGGVVRLPPPGLFQFDSGSSIFSVANDKILVTVNVVNVAGTANDTYVYRLLPNGQIDAGFGTAGSTFVPNLQHNVRIAPDQTIVLGGLDSTQPNNALIFTRLTVDGIVDPSFGTNGRTDVLLADAVQGGNAQLEVTSGGVVYAYSYGAGAARDFALFRLTANGLPDATWGTAGRVNVAPTNRQDDLRATRLQSVDKIVLLARTRRAAFPSQQEFLLARLNSDGSLDASFGTGGVVETLVSPVVASGNDFASALRVLADGRIIVAGRFNSTLATGQDIVVMRYLANGTLDPAFGSGGIKTVGLSRVTDSANALDIDDDGTIVIGGDIAYVDNDRSTASVFSPVGTAHVTKLSSPLVTAPPSLLGAQSRKVHGGAGTFDLPLVLAPITNPTTEPRQGPAQTIVFMFDKPVASATVTITEGTATPAAPTFSGNGVIVDLTNVTNQQYVAVSLTNVAGADGSVGGSGSARIGFLAGDVNQNRVVSLSDLGLVNAQLAQPVTATNYLKDVNASGTLSLSDKAITNANLTKALPPP